jgi:hypothetical protein
MPAILRRAVVAAHYFPEVCNLTKGAATFRQVHTSEFFSQIVDVKGYNSLTGDHPSSFQGQDEQFNFVHPHLIVRQFGNYLGKSITGRGRIVDAMCLRQKSNKFGNTNGGNGSGAHVSFYCL